MIVEAQEGSIIDDSTLRKKIDVLFDGAYTEVDSRNGGYTRNGTSKMSATEAKEEIMKWGETEFGLSNGEKEMISEIYEEIDMRVDNSFSKEELFRHLRDTQMTPQKIPERTILGEGDESEGNNAMNK